MKQAEISRAFKRKVCSEVEIEAEGVDRFVVHTPFQFDDGDHYVVVLKRESGHWTLTDEGHTFMHLSYADVDLSSGTRAQMIHEALLSHNVENNDGELRLEVPDKEFGDALFSFVQALGQVANTALWTHEKVRSTFFEDVTDLIQTSVPFGRVQAEYSDPDVDPEKKYPVDFMIRGKENKRWFIFAVATDTQCQQSTIACLKYETENSPFSSLVIYENQIKIVPKYVAQLGDVSGKSFSTLQRDRIKRFLETEVVGNNGEKVS